MSDPIYFNFPVPMLQDAFKNIHKLMDDIMDYAGYAHTLKLEHGTDEKKMKAAGEFLNIKWGNHIGSYRRGRELYNSFCENLPKVGINHDVLFDFYKKHKTQDDIAVLLAYLAIKSAIGDKPYTKMTNAYLIARMGGYTSINDVPVKLPEPLATYSSRRKLDKIKFELQANWNINLYSRYMRGFYVSIDSKFKIDLLVLQAEKKRKSNIEKLLKDKKETALLKAMQSLNIK